MIGVMLRRWSLVLLLVPALGLAASPARATAEAPPPAPRTKVAKKRLGTLPLRVVKLLPETGQALVYDQTRRAHVLVQEGDLVAGYAVVEVGDEHVVVARDGRELVLVADPRAPQLAPGAEAAVLDPYGDAAPAAPAGKAPAGKAPAGLQPIDPYARPDEGPVREVLAPAAQRESLRGVAVVDPYAPQAPPEPRVVTAPPTASPLRPTPAPGSPAAPEAIRAEVLTVKRAELEAALSDFTRLGKDIGFVRLPRGVRLGTVAPSSYFWRLGLRGGDVVTAIDGKPLRTLDDAAAAYVRLGTARQLAVEVERAGARGTLRFALQ